MPVTKPVFCPLFQLGFKTIETALIILKSSSRSFKDEMESVCVTVSVNDAERKYDERLKILWIGMILNGLYAVITVLRNK